MTRRQVPPPLATVQLAPRTGKAKAEKRGEISSIGGIFSTAWRLYKKRALPILAVMLLTSLFGVMLLAGLGIGGIFAFGFDAQQLQLAAKDLPELQANPSLIVSHPLFPFLVGGGLIFFFAAILLGAWQQTALLAAAVDEHHGIIESLCTGWKYVLPMLWVSTLYFGIVTAGFSLLILPGLLLALSMSFCFCVMLDEERTGIDALTVSRFYVRGRWLNTFVKMLLISLLFMAVSLVPVLPLLFTPFMLLYIVAVYRDLKDTAGIADPDSSCRCFWRLMAAVGLFLPLLGMIGTAVAVGPKLPGRLQELRENALEIIRKEAAKQGVELPIPPTEKGEQQPDDEQPEESVPSVQMLPSVDGFLVWRDPAGDTDNPLLDIREVSAKGEDGGLRLNVTLTRPLADYFAAQGRTEFNLLLNSYIDTDLKNATGDAPLEGRPGYDLDLEVRLAGPPGDPAAGRVYASLHRLAPQQKQSLDPLDANAVSFEGHSLHIRLPYERLAAAAGGSVRICFQEAAQAGGGLSKDKIVPLK
jgi:hypothetical protein